MRTSDELALGEMLSTLRTWLKTSRDSQRLWDILTSLRGPDSGIDQPASERPGDESAIHSTRYRARVDRKMATVAVIRATSGLSGGSARTRSADHVILPPSSEWDHFDKHVARAAEALGLVIKTPEKRIRHRC